MADETTSPNIKDTENAPEPTVTSSSNDGSKRDIAPERNIPFKDYVRVFSYGSGWDIPVLLVGIIAAAGTGITTPLMFVLFGDIVGQSNSFVTGNAEMDLGAFQNNLDRLCLYMFALFLARFGLGAIHKFAFRMTGIRLSAAIRSHYLKHLFGQGIQVLDTLPPGHAVGTITATSNTLQMGISERLGTLVENTSLIIAALVVALTWSWELALVTMSGFVAIVLLVGTIFPLTLKYQARKTESEDRAVTAASEAFASIRMIMACSAQQQIVDRYAGFIDEAKKYARTASPLTSIQFALTFFGVFATVALTFWYGALLFTRERLDNVGVIIVVLLSLTTVFFSLERISAPMQVIGKASLAANEFFSIIDAPLPNQGWLKAPEVSAAQDLIFDKVTFAYSSRPDVKVLDELDLCIEAGKVTAIVGPSGSGKSTIVGLIERWYSLTQHHVIAKATQQDKGNNERSDRADQETESSYVDAQIGSPANLSGAIRTGDRSLEDIDVKWWRSQIGMVQQEPFLFNDTIYNNVSRGLIGSVWEKSSEEEKRRLVKEACQEAFADEFIDKLPHRYDTNVGDSGARLSGGQRQRIAIARSIIKKPSILILDEATSAIDVKAERIVQAALHKAARGRTTIVIAHRLSTVKNADRIVVLTKGRVTESGTHESLMSVNGGVYSRLVNAQAISLGSAENEVMEDEVKTGTEATAPEVTGRSKIHATTVDSTAIGKLRGFFGSFGRFFIESRTYWGLIAFSIAMAAAAGAAQPIYAWLFARSIDVFRFQDNHPRLMHEVSFLAGMWTVFATSAGITYFLAFVSAGRVSSFIRAKYQTEYFESLVYQDAGYFDRDGHSHGTLISRVRDDPSRLEEMMGTNIAQVCIAIGNVIGGVVMALSYSWNLALVSLCAVIPVCIFSGYVRFRYELLFDKMNDEVFADSSQFAAEAIGAIRTVTSLALEESITDRFEKLCHGHVVAADKKARWISIVLGFSDSATLGAQALIFYYGGRLLAQNEIGIMAFFVCLMATMNAAEGFGQSLSFGPNAVQATAASNRILDARDSRLTGHDGHDDIPETGKGIKIEFCDIMLRYPTRPNPVLNKLSMVIEKGQFVALVGASGCGKTSIISLLERFYAPDKGRILCNGKDISDIGIYTYRKHFALVSQEPSLIQGTIRDNILLGIDPATISEEQLHTVCRDASIYDFIASLPEGFNTNIGTRGVSLSGGQKQRISIARALIRNPKILLLDEATSALDLESERLVQTALECASEGRTTIAVAHRLTSIQKADVIFVMGEGGRILESGSHAELLARRGEYYQMCQNQALR